MIAAKDFRKALQSGLPDKPQRSKLIAFWGLQKDGIFVLANAVFDTATGLLLRIDQTEWAIWASTFTADKVHAIPEYAFPRMVMMPLHCKYTVGFKLINEICPQMFVNNYWPALAVLAGQIIGMYYPYLQSGQVGGGSGSPLFYITGDHGTGKSSAAICCRFAISYVYDKPLSFSRRVISPIRGAWNARNQGTIRPISRDDRAAAVADGGRGGGAP